MKNQPVLLQRKKIFQGYDFDVVNDQLTWTNGKNLSQSSIIHHGISVMVPILKRDQIILLKQYRYVIGKTLWEVPAGTIKKGETSLQCAKRELEEETGYKAKSWRKLTLSYTSPGISTELIHCYVASVLKKSQMKLEEDEILQMTVLSKNTVRNMIKEQKIRDAKSLIALFYYFNGRV